MNKSSGNFISEFFADLKPKKIVRIYTPLLMAKRMLFVIIILILQSFGKNLTFSIMFIFQVPYTIYLLIIRPFEAGTDNFIEVMNETFYIVFIVLFWSLDSEKSWTLTMVRL